MKTLKQIKILIIALVLLSSNNFAQISINKNLIPNKGKTFSINTNKQPIKKHKTHKKINFKIHYDLPYLGIFLCSNDTIVDISLINYEKERLLDKGKYNMIAFSEIDSNNNYIPTKLFFKRQILVDSIHDTLNIYNKDAKYKVTLNGVDENGEYIINNNKGQQTIYALTTNYNDSKLTGYVYYKYPFNEIYSTKLPDSTFMLCSQEIFNLKKEKKATCLNFPAITNLNQDTILTNSPDVYTKSNIEVNIPSSEIQKTVYTGINSFVTLNDFIYYLWFPFSPPVYDTLNFETQNKINTTLYLTNDYNDNMVSSIYYYIPKSEQMITFRSSDHKSTIYEYSKPTQDLFFATDTDTIIIGKGLIYIKNKFENNHYANNYISFFLDICFQMKDYQSNMHETSKQELYNNQNQLLKSTQNGWNPNTQLYIEPQNYYVKTVDSGFYVNGNKGKATMYNFFNLADTIDAIPPVLNVLQIRNSLGKPTELLAKNEQATLHFSCADSYFIDKIHSGKYRSIVADSTHVYIKQSQENSWTEIEYQTIGEDTVEYGTNGGYYYIANIPQQFTNTDSSAIDLRIVFIDSSGNKTDYTLDPAVGIGRYKAPFYMPVTVPDYYNTIENNSITIDKNNGVLVNDTVAEQYKLTAYLKRPTVHGNIIFNSDGSFTYTPNTNFIGQDGFIYQAVSGGTIKSIEQHVFIEVSKSTAIRNSKNNITSLQQNFPNPVINNTTIDFSINKSDKVTLIIFDNSGKYMTTLVNSYMQQGEHKIYWNKQNNTGHTLPCGIYFYRLSTNNTVITKKLIIN